MLILPRGTVQGNTVLVVAASVVRAHCLCDAMAPTDLSRLSISPHDPEDFQSLLRSALVLENGEHVVEAGSSTNEVLARCPKALSGAVALLSHRIGELNTRQIFNSGLFWPLLNDCLFQLGGQPPSQSAYPLKSAHFSANSDDRDSCAPASQISSHSGRLHSSTVPAHHGSIRKRARLSSWRRRKQKRHNAVMAATAEAANVAAMEAAECHAAAVRQAEEALCGGSSGPMQSASNTHPARMDTAYGNAGEIRPHDCLQACHHHAEHSPSAQPIQVQYLKGELHSRPFKRKKCQRSIMKTIAPSKSDVLKLITKLVRRHRRTSYHKLMWMHMPSHSAACSTSAVMWPHVHNYAWAVLASVVPSQLLGGRENMRRLLKAAVRLGILNTAVKQRRAHVGAQLTEQLRTTDRNRVASRNSAPVSQEPRSTGSGGRGAQHALSARRRLRRLACWVTQCVVMPSLRRTLISVSNQRYGDAKWNVPWPRGVWRRSFRRACRQVKRASLHILSAEVCCRVEPASLIAQGC